MQSIRILQISGRIWRLNSAEFGESTEFCRILQNRGRDLPGIWPPTPGSGVNLQILTPGSGVRFSKFCRGAGAYPDFDLPGCSKWRLVFRLPGIWTSRLLKMGVYPGFDLHRKIYNSLRQMWWFKSVSRRRSSPPSMIEDLRELLRSGDGADFVVEVGERTFDLHIFVLRLSSGYFRHLFN